MDALILVSIGFSVGTLSCLKFYIKRKIKKTFIKTGSYKNNIFKPTTKVASS